MGAMRYQPQGFKRLVRGHALTRGLVFAAVPGGPELISGVFPTRIGNADLAIFEHGRSFKSSSNTTDGWHWILPPNHPIYSITTEDSSFILANRASGAVASNFFGIPYRAEGWTTPFYAWTLATSSGSSTSGGYNYAPSASVRRTTTMAGFYTNGKTQAYGVTRNGARVRYYAGGAQVGADAAITAGSPDFVNRRPPVLFNRSSDSPAEGTTGQAAVVLVWNRELSPEEWKAVNDNPWQLFESPEEPQESKVVATVTYANTTGFSAGTSSSSALARAIADAYGTSTPAAVANATIQSVRNTAGSASSAATTGSATQAIQNIKGEASSATTSSGSSQTVQNVSGAASASAATSATMRSVFQVVGASQGAAIATAPAFSITQTVGSANGTASVSGNVVSVACTSGGSTGSATVSGNAACVWQVVGNANGTATVTAVSSFESGGGTVFIDTVGASYGSATSDAVARAIANINGNALGSSLGTSQAQTLTNAIGAALSSSMAAGTGATVVTTTGTAVAQAQTQAQVFTVKNSAGQATGTSSTQSVAITIYDTVAASLSVSEVQAVAQAIVNATGRSAGVSTVSGMTNGGVHYIATGDQFNVTIVFSPYVVTLEEKPISIRLEPKKYGVNIN